MTRNAPILFFTFSLRGGGSASIIKTLSAHYAGDTNIHVCTMELPESPWLEGITIHRLPVNRYKFLGSLGVYLQIIYQLRILLLRIKPGRLVSFIHIANILSVVASWRTNTPVIVCERSDIFKTKIGKLWKLIRPLAYSYADLLCLQNRSDVKAIPSYLLSKTAFARNPIKEPLKANSIRNNHLVSVGRLNAVKRYDLLIELCLPLLQKDVELELHIFGEGEQRTYLEGLIHKLGMSKQIKLRGQVDNIPSELSRFKIFLMTSFSEGQPNALLEALATGLTSICFDSSPCFQEIKKSFSNLHLIEDGDQKKFSTMLANLISHEMPGVQESGWNEWNRLAWLEWDTIIYG